MAMPLCKFVNIQTKKSRHLVKTIFSEKYVILCIDYIEIMQNDRLFVLAQMSKLYDVNVYY